MKTHLATKHAFCLALILAGPLLPGRAATPNPPNILWITSEDTGPQLGCYGDAYATTPHLDDLAAKGMLYRNAWSSAPVCAPARTAIISGLYPPSTGSEHMRSLTRLPSFMRMYPQFLREAGYYCSNNQKEDYNLEKPGRIWDESSGKAHWKNRKPGQPFFAIFNHTVSHESQIRIRPHTPVHDPAQARVPAYHPDTPEVRRDWAQYYDKVTEMDALAGQTLRELGEAGLADETVVFYYGDHGSGMPRSKRWPYNSGLHVPLIVYIPTGFQHLAPPDYKPGGQTARLVDFVDLAPTVLSLAGIKPPSWMQGHAFLGLHQAKPRKFLYGFRGRMDERYDLVRSVRDEHHVYIRNYMPHKIYGQHVSYMFETPTTQVWKQLYDQDKLQPPQSLFWQPKPPEELYDLKSDPDEIRNLATSPAHQAILKRLRKAHRDWELDIRDVGFLPEEEIHTRSSSRSPFEIGHDNEAYPFRKILNMADLASSLQPDALPDLIKGLDENYSALRYWAALGILMRGQPAVQSAHAKLLDFLRDPSPSVRVVAAEALAKFGQPADADAALPVLLDAANLNLSSEYVSILALSALDELDDKAAPWKSKIEALPKRKSGSGSRTSGYTARLLDKTLQDLNAGR